MAHGISPILKRGPTAVGGKNASEGGKTGIGSRRIFPPHFKLQVLDSYRNDADCKGNQRATARKYGIHRRQIQKWLQCENALRNSVSKIGKSKNGGEQATTAVVLPVMPEARKCGIELALRGSTHRQLDDCCGPDACAGQQREMDARVPALSPCSIANEQNGHQIQTAAVTVPVPVASANPISEAPWSHCRGGSPTALATSAAALSPLDFTVHSRASSAVSPSAANANPIALAAPVADPAAPMDLSFKRPTAANAPVYYASAPHLLYPLGTTATAASGDSTSPLPATAPVASPLSSSTTSTTYSTSVISATITQSLTEVWDLSTKASKHKLDEVDVMHERSPVSPSPSSPCENKPKPFKLFKPYLDDLHDEDREQREPIIMKNDSYIPCCNACLAPTPETENHYFNNNHIMTTEYSYSFSDYLPPKTYHMYPMEETYMYRTSECDASNLCSYEEGTVLQPIPLKQRQSYSLDFKLSAIECYYQDSLCKGNQRAVAHRYNIHRRQVQKWLKQEDELRQRNDSFKPIHAVR